MVAAGLVLGLAPVHRAGVSCGSAFKGSGAGQVQDYTNALTGYGLTDVSDLCDSATSDRKTIAWVAIAPGALLVLVGGVWAVLVNNQNGTTVAQTRSV